jgi:hypothetical protein
MTRRRRSTEPGRRRANIKRSVVRRSQMIQLAQMVRRCPDCGSDQPFEQYHPEDLGCPDSADGECPEWSCTACGAALLLGLAHYADVPYADETRIKPDIRDRVA